MTACALMNSGTTAYDALVNWKADKGGMTVGVVGVGGLGQSVIKTAKHFGNKVIAFSSNAAKETIAKGYGADNFSVISDAEGRKALAASCNLILDTRSVEHQIKDNLDICANSGVIVELGLMKHDHKVNHMTLFP